jgi:hypothetical protein
METRAIKARPALLCFILCVCYIFFFSDGDVRVAVN